MTVYKRYQGIIPTALDGFNYTVTLEREDAKKGDPMRELRFYGEGFTLERETQQSILTPMLPTRLTLFLQSELNYSFEHIAKDRLEWCARVDFNAIPLFLGRVETGLYEEDFAEPPYEVRLTATCGLQSLYDDDMNIEEIPINQFGVTRLSDFLTWLLKGAYPKGNIGNTDIGEGVARKEIYIDPLDFATNDKPMKKGEVLETILHDFALNVRSVGAVFTIQDVFYQTSNPDRLIGDMQHPLYATPQLQSDRGIGQLLLTLPNDEVTTLAPYHLPAAPVRQVNLPNPLFGAKGEAMLPLPRQIAVSPLTTATPPTNEEKEQGVTLVCSQMSVNAQPDKQGILIAFPIDEPFYQNILDVTIPMQFTIRDGQSIPSDGEVMNCIDAYLCHFDEASTRCEVCYQATIGDVYREPVMGDPLTYFNAIYQEESAELYKISVAGRTPRDKSTAGWTDCRMAHNVIVDDIKTSRYPSFADEMEATRNYSKVSVSSLYEKQEFAQFRYSFLPPLLHIMAYHNARRKQRGEAPKPVPNYMLLRIPFYFWHEWKDNIGKSHSDRLYPEQVKLGKVTIKYRSIDDEKEVHYTEWVTADRATTWLRKEEDKLTYSTLVPELEQNPSLRHKLLNERGQWLPYLYESNGKPVSLVAHFVERKMRCLARSYDTLTASIKSEAFPHFVGMNRFTVKGRPGKCYYAMGAVYHPGEGANEELTLIEIPPTKLEDTSFVK